nr:MAG TPA: hypothetical protein [Caudoviricetes sp.]
MRVPLLLAPYWMITGICGGRVVRGRLQKWAVKMRRWLLC